MTQHPSDVEFSYHQPEAPKKGWFGRNWLWFIPTVVILHLLCCCGGPLGLMWFGLSVLFNSPPYKDTIALAEQHPIVQQEIGTPIDAPDGFMDLVNAEQQGGTIDATDLYFYADVPITGPNGSGWMYVEATSSDGVNWSYTSQEITIDSTGETIDLLAGSSSPDGSDVPEDGSDREIPDQE